VNRSSRDIDFVKGNITLTDKIIEIIKNFNLTTVVFYASSTQAAWDNVYGKTKLEAENLILQAQNDTNAQFYIYRFPNLFGKMSKPNYNSVIATFCHNIARGEEIKVNDSNRELQLLFVDDVVEELGKLPYLYESEDFEAHLEERLKPFSASLGAISEKLISFQNNLVNNTIPNVLTEFDRALLATYLSFLPAKNCLLRTQDFKFLSSKNYNKKNFSVSTQKTIEISNRNKGFQLIPIKGCELKVEIKNIDILENYFYEISQEEHILLILSPNFDISFSNTEDLRVNLQSFQLKDKIYMQGTIL
jgi:UDP-2-acetamido-2,6-beta-L-arabino-hexul-4-ose reductase